MATPVNPQVPSNEEGQIAAPVEPQIPVDEEQAAAAPIGVDNDDNDSALGESFGSDTTSLNSSITAYRQENGRRYHAYKEGEYWGPNDDQQNEQLDIAHHLHTLIMDGKLFLAPIDKNVQKVLDLGTGTGIWAIDFADQYPSASITGTDLSPIQPSWVPPNVKFEIDDFNDEWTFRRNEFDFIHLKCLFGSVGDWPKLYRQVYDHLKPGAWMEAFEISIVFRCDDDSIKPDSVMKNYGNIFIEAGERRGKSMRIAEDMKELIDKVGFVNVVEKVYKAPIRGWPSDPKLKEQGRWGLLELEVGIEGFALALLTRVMDWQYTEVQAFIGNVRSELRNRDIHAYHNIHVVYAQKPPAETSSHVAV